MAARTLTVLIVLWLAATCAADDRSRKARAALALAATVPEPKAAKAEPAVAPMPRTPAPKDYATGYKEAAAEQTPLVVYVGCDGPRVEGAVTSRVAADSLGDVRGPVVVVAIPKGDRLLVDAQLPCPIDPVKLKAAVDAARKKIDGPVIQKMPPAPTPLNWQIRGPLDCGPVG